VIFFQIERIYRTVYVKLKPPPMLALDVMQNAFVAGRMKTSPTPVPREITNCADVVYGPANVTGDAHAPPVFADWKVITPTPEAVQSSAVM
jgi:hypothetical protein